ncbi:MAG: winged helix-turn-helix domain-containing protein [Bacillota bacterium]
MDSPRILIVDDDDAIAEIVATYLRREGYQTERAADGPSALDRIRTGGWSLVLLDVMLPGLDGFEICRTVRAEGVTVPILFLTARSEDVDQVLGLGLGGDDYITKPFSGAALAARVKAHLRRYRMLAAPAAEQEWLRFPGLEIDLAGCEVRRNGQPVALTAKEFELLRFMAGHRGRVFTREQIFTHVWGEDYLADDNTVMVHIRRLREKIEEDPSDPRYLVTVRGLGYRFTGGA